MHATLGARYTRAGERRGNATFEPPAESSNDIRLNHVRYYIRFFKSNPSFLDFLSSPAPNPLPNFIIPRIRGRDPSQEARLLILLLHPSMPIRLALRRQSLFPRRSPLHVVATKRE
jgi:hypothetical protein